MVAVVAVDIMLLELMARLLLVVMEGLAHHLQFQVRHYFMLVVVGEVYLIAVLQALVDQALVVLAVLILRQEATAQLIVVAVAVAAVLIHQPEEMDRLAWSSSKSLTPRLLHLLVV
jgi:hypothetical protein